MSKYLMKSAAAIVLGFAAAACSHDLGFVEEKEQQSLDNAQATLGFYIPENQDWKMSSEASVNVTIPGDANETYTVMVFANNPIKDGIGYYLTKQNLRGGQNLATDVAYPMHLKSLVIGITDSNNKTTYKSARIENGKVTTLGDISAARTRAEANERDHSGDGNTEHNQWAAIDNIYKLQVPPPLTDGQKLRVRMYFQSHPNLTYVDPHLTNFFVQQVYKGNNATAGTLSAEQYPTGNDDIVVGSNHMDWLTVGSNNKHVNDFNYGDYDGGHTATVLNNGVKQNDYQVGVTTHEDQITLMLGAQTDCVGFAVSNGTYHHNDCMALANAKTIDDWARAQNTVIGEDVWYGNDIWGNPNSKWQRSFVGLDYEQLPPQECYVNEVDANWQPISGTVAYVKVDDVIQPNYIRMTTTTEAGTKKVILSKAEYKTIYGEFLLDRNGHKIPYVNRNSNEICGTNVDFDDQNAYMPRTDCTSAGGGNNDQILELDLIWDKVDINALPCKDGSLKNWIKDIGGRDYVFSDWIVTLTPADDTNIIINHDPAVWSYAFEDNSYSCDFDMNDVVLRVNVNKEDDTKFDVTLVAAGCEYDNYVFLGNQLITWPNGSEVHDALGAGKGQMINTGKGVSKTPVTVTIARNNYNPENAPFKIWPYKTNGMYGNTADQKEASPIPVTLLEGSGKAPLGIIVPGKWAWPTERTIITEAYSQFVKWATNVVHIEETNDATDWYDHPTSGKVVVMP
jgi:hypothetical protein